MDAPFLVKNGLVWEICSDECKECGRPSYKVNVIVVSDNDFILPVAACYSQEDAVAFINNVKKAGITVVNKGKGDVSGQ